MTNLYVNGGNPNAGDTVSFTGLAGFNDDVEVSPSGAGSGQITDIGTALPTVTFTGLGGVSVIGQTADSDGIRYVGTTSSDTFTWTPGVTPDAGTITGSTNGDSGSGAYVFTPLSYSGITSFVQPGSGFGNGPTGGTDTIIVDGTSGNDAFGFPNPTPFGLPAITLTTAAGIYPGLYFDPTGGTSSIILRGLGGNDIYNLNFNPPQGDGSVPITIQGTANDVINYTANTDASGATTVDLDASTINSTAQDTINFVGITKIHVDAGLGALNINGTGSGNAITYTPTGVEAGTITNGTVTVNAIDVTGGLTFDPGAGTNSVTINGTSGANAITATGLAAPTVQVGGLLPATLVAADIASVNINGLGGNDALTVDSSALPFAIPIFFDGGVGSNNTITLQGGSANADTFTPGAAPIPAPARSTSGRRALNPSILPMSPSPPIPFPRRLSSTAPPAMMPSAIPAPACPAMAPSRSTTWA